MLEFFSDRFITVAFDGKHPFSKLIGTLKLQDKLSAAAFLTALEGESDSVVEEAFDHLDDMCVTLDISDLPHYAADSTIALRLKQEQEFVKKENLLTALEETDPLRVYLEELASIPVCGDVEILAEELYRCNRDEVTDSSIFTQLLNLSLSRVVEIAKEYVGYGVLLMDLIQEGCLGLWKGLPCIVGNFQCLRDMYIRSYMVRSVIVQARNAGLDQQLRQGMEDYLDIDQRLLTELGRNPTLEEIAQQMHVSLEEAATIENMLSAARTMQRAHAQKAPETPEPEDEQAVEDTAYFQSRQRIMELLSALDAEDAQLLSLRFGLEGGVPLTPQQVGERMGLTADQVVAREGAALAKLRENQD